MTPFTLLPLHVFNKLWLNEILFYSRGNFWLITHFTGNITVVSYAGFDEQDMCGNYLLNLQ